MLYVAIARIEILKMKFYKDLFIKQDMTSLGNFPRIKQTQE